MCLLAQNQNAGRTMPRWWLIPLPCFYLASAIAAYSAEFGTFDEEARRFSSEVFCPTAKVTPLEGSGRVFGCVPSESATVKFAIHELGRTGRVEKGDVE